MEIFNGLHLTLKPFNSLVQEVEPILLKMEFILKILNSFRETIIVLEKFYHLITVLKALIGIIQVRVAREILFMKFGQKESINYFTKIFIYFISYFSNNLFRIYMIKDLIFILPAD